MNLYLLLHPRRTVYDVDRNRGIFALVQPIHEHTFYECQVRVVTRHGCLDVVRPGVLICRSSKDQQTICYKEQKLLIQ